MWGTSSYLGYIADYSNRNYLHAHCFELASLRRQLQHSHTISAGLLLGSNLPMVVHTRERVCCAVDPTMSEAVVISPWRSDSLTYVERWVPNSQDRPVHLQLPVLLIIAHWHDSRVRLNLPRPTNVCTFRVHICVRASSSSLPCGILAACTFHKEPSDNVKRASVAQHTHHSYQCSLSSLRTHCGTTSECLSIPASKTPFMSSPVIVICIPVASMIVGDPGNHQ